MPASLIRAAILALTCTLPVSAQNPKPEKPNVTRLKKNYGYLMEHYDRFRDQTVISLSQIIASSGVKSYMWSGKMKMVTLDTRMAYPGRQFPTEYKVWMGFTISDTD